MPTDVVAPLSAFDVGLGAGLVLLSGAISLAFGLGLERRLFIAALRVVVQLVAVGYVLEMVFGLDRGVVVLVVWLLMTVMAARAAVNRTTRRYRGQHIDTFVALFVASWVSTAVVTQVVIRVSPWYQPQYVIPLLGMTLGNGLTGISLCIESCLEAFDKERDQVELRLSLGASAKAAARPVLREGVRRGMIPMINAMSVVGIVSLPGMMTGQILAGTSPLTAVLYQIVVMFMVAGTTAAGSILAALMVERRMFDGQVRLCLERLQER